MPTGNQAQATTEAQAEQPAAKKKASPAKRKPSSRKSEIIVVKSKRKRTVARAYVRSGSGSIKINGTPVSSVEFDVERKMLMEPMVISNAAKEYAKGMDISINVKGGGVSGRMQAARNVIARGIVAFSNDKAVRSEYLLYDRSLLIDDPRRVEPKKVEGPKARAKFQTSYR